MQWTGCHQSHLMCGKKVTVLAHAVRTYALEAAHDQMLLFDEVPVDDVAEGWRASPDSDFCRAYVAQLLFIQAAQTRKLNDLRIHHGPNDVTARQANQMADPCDVIDLCNSEEQGGHRLARKSNYAEW